MGSMTPKISAMKIIDDLEETEDYTGAGLFTPNGDFDFNVVIRVLYNQNKYILFCVAP
jgi:anthranilate/para-aminobenzoate synthase component I